MSTPDPTTDMEKVDRYLDRLVDRYEEPDFIEGDPISIPHQFDRPRDQEVIGLYAAILAWGRRNVILNKLRELCARMDEQPYQFVLEFDPHNDGNRLEGFVHRTFQPSDAVWFTANLSRLLRTYETVEGIFAADHTGGASTTEQAIEGFSRRMMNADPKTPDRLGKHLARPSKGSACKRLNMYLRWMVRPGPVDFGIWDAIHPRQLVLPLDTHAATQARKLDLITRKSTDWKAALELTEHCRRMCPSDPARYDLALFGAGIDNNAE